MRVSVIIVLVGVALGIAGRAVRTGGELAEPAARVDRQPASTQPAAPQPVEETAPPDEFAAEGLVPPARLFPDDSLASLSHGASDERALFEPHGEQVCASGCAVSRHPTEELSAPQFRRLLRQFADQPISEDSQALETLLFYGRQTTVMLDEQGVGPLDPVRASFLRDQLTRTDARISIRVVDQSGVVRTWLPPTRVPLDRRHVFSMDVNNVQPLVTSGTVKRVGLHHLWTRL